MGDGLQPDEATGSSICEKLLQNARQQKALSLLNPPVKIKPIIASPKNRPHFTVHVICDDELIGGTKQRGLTSLCTNPSKEFVYAGPVQGFAQIALANAARVAGKIATVVVARQRDGRLFPLTQRAKDLGAQIVEVSPPNTLKDVQAYSEIYTQARNLHIGDSHAPHTVLLPFGLHCDWFLESLVSNIRLALPPGMMAPTRLWLTAGSATLLAALATIWPSTHFMVVQVGKTIWPDQLGLNPDGSRSFNSDLFVAPEKFFEIALKQPPYASVATYDAKAWQFILLHGREGDFVWNVGGDGGVVGDSGGQWETGPPIRVKGHTRAKAASTSGYPQSITSNSEPTTTLYRRSSSPSGFVAKHEHEYEEVREGERKQIRIKILKILHIFIALQFIIACSS